MIVTRPPLPALRPFVQQVWAGDGSRDDTHGAPAERMLPTGATHVVLRLTEEPLRLYETAAGSRETRLPSAVVGGVRSEPYFKDVSRPAASVGAILEPGGAALLFGLPASELAGRHTPLEELWGRSAPLLVERLAETAPLARRLALFERELLARLPTVRGLHPGIAHALRNLTASEPGQTRSGAGAIARAAAASALSQRRFSQLFREAVGVAPKRWTRLQRFQAVVQHLARDPETDLAELALRFGYNDQPHLTREFREFAGLSPGAYRRLAPRSPNHVPLAELPISSRPEPRHE